MLRLLKKEAIYIPLFFLFLTIIFFYQIFLGKIPLPADLIVGGYYPWLDYKWDTIAGVPVKNPIISDAVSIIYPLKMLAVQDLKKAEFPFWNPYMFGGYPLFASIQLGLLYPTMIFYLFSAEPVGWTLQVMSQVFLGLIFSYLFLRQIKLSKGASIFGSIVYSFGGFSMIWLEWNTHVATAIYLPLLLFLGDKFISLSKFKHWGVLFSLALACQILAGYIQLVLPCLLITAFWLLINKINLKQIISLSFYTLLGVGLTSILVLPSYELIKLSQRAVENLSPVYIFTPYQYFLTFLFPDFFGNHSTGNFWGSGTYHNVTLYSGVLTIILASIGIRESKSKKLIYFFGITTLVTLLLTIYSPFSLSIHNTGIFGGSSISVSRFLFIVNFSLAVLAAFGIDGLKNISVKKILVYFLSFLLIMILISSYLYFSKTYILHYANLLQNQAFNNEVLTFTSYINVSFRNTIVPIFLVFCVVIYLIISFKLKFLTKYLLAFLILILCFELFRFGLKFNSFSSPKYLYPETPVLEFLKQFPNDRVTAKEQSLPANMWVPYGISSFSGYDGVYPLTVAQMIGSINANSSSASPQQKWGVIDTYNSHLFDLTTKYIVTPKYTRAGEISEIGLIPEIFSSSKFKKVFNDKSVAVLENLRAVPRAFVVTNVQIANNSQILEKLNYWDTNQMATAYTNEFEMNSTPSLNNPNLYSTNYQPTKNNLIQIAVNSDNPGFLVINNTYFPGWKAFVNNQSVKLHQTNYNFMGVEVPKGQSIVTLYYLPQSFILGLWLSILSSSILVIIITKNLKPKT